MYTSRSPFQVWSALILLSVSLCIGFYVLQYSTTVARFQEYSNSEPCLIALYPLIIELAILGASTVLIGLLLNSFIVYLDEARIKNLPIFCWRITDCVDYPVYSGIALLFFLCLFIAQCIQENDFQAMVERPILVFVFASFACSISMIFPYDNVDVSYAVNIKNSIGAAYAYGAYNSYYKIVAKKFITCVRDWEKENQKDIRVKKLIIICPLTCYIDGNLTQRVESNLDIIDDFTSHIGDQGANMNRKYKHTIYGIERSQDVTLVIAEFASPLGALYEQQQHGKIDKEKFEFVRDCFIFTLKVLLNDKDLPFIVVDYNDPSNSLDTFLLSVVEQDKSRSYKVKEV